MSLKKYTVMRHSGPFFAQLDLPAAAIEWPLEGRIEMPAVNLILRETLNLM